MKIGLTSSCGENPNIFPENPRSTKIIKLPGVKSTGMETPQKKFANILVHVHMYLAKLSPFLEIQVNLIPCTATISYLIKL